MGKTQTKWIADGAVTPPKLSAFDIAGVAEKTTIAANDLFLMQDSASSFVTKYIKGSNMGGGASSMQAAYDGSPNILLDFVSSTTVPIQLRYDGMVEPDMYVGLDLYNDDDATDDTIDMVSPAICWKGSHFVEGEPGEAHDIRFFMRTENLLGGLQSLGVYSQIDTDDPIPWWQFSDTGGLFLYGDYGLLDNMPGILMVTTTPSTEEATYQLPGGHLWQGTVWDTGTEASKTWMYYFLPRAVSDDPAYPLFIFAGNCEGTPAFNVFWTNIDGNIINFFGNTAIASASLPAKFLVSGPWGHGDQSGTAFESINTTAANGSVTEQASGAIFLGGQRWNTADGGFSEGVDVRMFNSCTMGSQLHGLVRIQKRIDEGSWMDILNIGSMRPEELSCSGSYVEMTVPIPKCQVSSVPIVVTEAINNATSISVGISGDTARYGSGISVAQYTADPGMKDGIRYYDGSGTTIRITFVGGTPTTGKVLIAVNYFKHLPMAL